MTEQATTFRGLIEGIGNSEAMARVTARQNASVIHAPQRKHFTPKRLYQVIVGGIATTGSGHSTLAWKLKGDAEKFAQRKRALLAHLGDTETTVKVKATSNSVATVREWVNADTGLYRQYRQDGDGYTYIGVSQ